ncbi:hypothetical protein LYNGBM3L_07150 [Moorena producens 3L]|uniref:Uncharacterized protein n=1 Tax=Moorena producens 3L TaxID=489825 RepID=F4XJS8_9CYAN|nr:hypothetical protein LYNGBM3L_07150 [Moorena producens 3L]OLT65612.1 hypothetical protein BI334_11730 [Moorena producens 3L]
MGAGNNLLLAKLLVQQEGLGLSKEAGEHIQYVDISPFIYSLFAVFGITAVCNSVRYKFMDFTVRRLLKTALPHTYFHHSDRICRSLICD